MPELEFQALSLTIGNRALLDSVSLRVEQSDFVALIGPNGAGKTSLLKSALGLVRPSSGAVRVLGQPLTALTGRARAQAVAWLPQHIRADEPVTGLETVAAARFRFHESHAASRKAATAALARVGASAYGARRMTELSGGERQRVAFACLVAQDARTLLFDEPANHLDPAQQLEVYRLLGELWREGRSVVCVTHDVNLLHQVGNAAHVRVVGMRAGRIAFEARLSDRALPEQLGALFGLTMSSVLSDGQRFIVPRAGCRP